MDKLKAAHGWLELKKSFGGPTVVVKLEEAHGCNLQVHANPPVVVDMGWVQRGVTWKMQHCPDRNQG